MTKLEAFNRLLNILDELREKCPWDKKQTLDSLTANTIEETYELIDSIQKRDFEEIKKELGDLLLHILFYAKITSEMNLFNIEDVINSLCEKLIYRHPHIYANAETIDEEQVKKNWEKLKLQEGRKSVLEGVPSSLPALLKCQRILEKVNGINFKLKEELITKKITTLTTEDSIENQEKELGNTLFNLVNFAKSKGLNAENALNKANDKFKLQFKKMEEIARANNLLLTELTEKEWQNLWKEVKNN